MPELEKLQVLQERIDHVSKKVDRHETLIENVTKDVQTLNKYSSETKVYIGQIFDSLEEIKFQLNEMKSNRKEDKPNFSLELFGALFVIIMLLGMGGIVAYLILMTR